VKATTERPALASVLRTLKRELGPAEDEYKPPVSTFPEHKAVALPGQLTLEDAFEEEADDAA
jgi:hypothetical protein